MDNWARTTKKEREVLFTETASRKGLSPEIVEKDFWVCWVLYQIFQLEDFPRLIFKGGTSLSKAFAIIKRFSEDVDLVINRHELGFINENDPIHQEGSNQRGRTITNLKTECRRIIATEFVPKLATRVHSILTDDGWTLEIDSTSPDRDTVEFKYPEGIPASVVGGYIKRSVRLELGCRGDQIPCEQAVISPYAAETFPSQFTVPATSVNVLSPERTFWEKATILHREYHRIEAGKPASERIFRHYHDLVMLSKHHRGKSAMKDQALLEQVAIHKKYFFRDASAQYEQARKGSLRLTPKDPIDNSLRKDYERMREMYFDDPPEFEDVMNDIRRLEQYINES